MDSPSWCYECGGVGGRHERSCWDYSPIAAVASARHHENAALAAARLCYPDRSGSPTWWRFNDDLLLATCGARRNAPAEITRWGRP